MSADADPDDLPLLTHEQVLGADIAVSQRDCERGEYMGHNTRERSVEVRAYTAGPGQDACRRYLAAWARRTIGRPESPESRPGARRR